MSYVKAETETVKAVQVERKVEDSIVAEALPPGVSALEVEVARRQAFLNSLRGGR